MVDRDVADKIKRDLFLNLDANDHSRNQGYYLDEPINEHDLILIRDIIYEFRESCNTFEIVINNIINGYNFPERDSLVNELEDIRVETLYMTDRLKNVFSKIQEINELVNK